MTSHADMADETRPHETEPVTSLLQRLRGNKVLMQLLRNPLAVVSALILVGFVLAGLFAPWVAPADPYDQDFARILAPPSAQNWLGTDEIGRDILSRVIWGIRYSYTIALGSVILGGVAGIPMGLIAGYFGGWADTVIMRFVDLLLAFPGLILALLVVSILGPGGVPVALATAIFSLPQYIRLVRGETLSQRDREHVQAARALGASSTVILVRHVLRNIWSAIIVLSTLRMAIVILAAGALGFLGLGVQPPEPEWGAMISVARDYIREAPHVVLGPGGALALSVIAFNLLGDGLRDALDPRIGQHLRG